MVPASLGPFLLSAPSGCIHNLLRCQLLCFMFYCDEHLKRKPHTNQKISSVNVCSAEGVSAAKTLTLWNPSLDCAHWSGLFEKRARCIQMCSKAGNFIFLLKMKCTLDVLCKSKVVHFNTTVCLHFFTCSYDRVNKSSERFPKDLFTADILTHCRNSKQVLLITFMTRLELFVLVSQLHQDAETEAAKWNWAFTNCIIYTQAFPIVASQCLLRKRLIVS